MTTDTDQVESPPVASPLDDLEHQANALDGITPPGAPPKPAEPTTTAADLEAALQMARMMVSPTMTWWADFGKVWSDRQLEQIAAAGATIMDRHGLSMGELLSTWGPYLALIAATVPPSLATYSAIRHHRAAPPQPQGRAPEEAEGVRP